MFPKPALPNGMNTIQRKTFEQVEMEQLKEAVDELRGEIKTFKQDVIKEIREEIKSFRSKFEAWEDITKLIALLREREIEVRTKESVATDLKLLLHSFRSTVKDLGDPST